MYLESKRERMGLKVLRTTVWVLNPLAVLYFLCLVTWIWPADMNVPRDLNHYQSSVSPWFRLFLKMRPSFKVGNEWSSIFTLRAAFVFSANLEEGCWECVLPIFLPGGKIGWFHLDLFTLNSFSFLIKDLIIYFHPLKGEISLKHDVDHFDHFGLYI